MDDFYSNIEEYKANKKIFIVFDDMIADMLSNANLNLIVTEVIHSHHTILFCNTE